MTRFLNFTTNYWWVQQIKHNWDQSSSAERDLCFNLATWTLARKFKAVSLKNDLFCTYFSYPDQIAGGVSIETCAKNRLLLQSQDIWVTNFFAATLYLCKLQKKIVPLNCQSIIRKWQKWTILEFHSPCYWFSAQRYFPDGKVRWAPLLHCGEWEL